MPDDHALIAELQLQLLAAQDHIDALERNAYRQQRQLDLLQAQLRELHRRISAAGLDDARGAAAADDPREDIPPHY